MLRARKRELLDEQRSGWVEGRPAQPEELIGRWPTNPDTDPDAASLLLEDYLQRRRRRPGDQPVGLPATDSPSRRGVRGAARAGDRCSVRWAGESDGTGFPLRLPDVGDEVFGFRLCRPSEKGRSPGCSWRSRPTWRAARSC